MALTASLASRQALSKLTNELRGTPDTPIVSEDELRQHLYIMDTNDNVIRYVPNRIQRDLESKLTGRDLIIKYRQGGISTFFIIKKSVKAMTKTARIGIMAHDDQTTQKLRRMADLLWKQLPSHLRPLRGLDNASTTTYRQTLSEVTIATAGSVNAGRGGTYPGGFYGSEVAFWKDAKGIMSAIMQGVPLHAPIALETTANGASGFVYEEAMKALRGESIWTLHFYQWWWDDRYQIALAPDETLTPTAEEADLMARHSLTLEQIKWRRYKQTELGDVFFQEYPEDIETCFLVSGRGVFQLDKPNLFTRCHEDRSILGFPVWVADDYVADDKSVHALGIDWGQNPDSTAVSIWDSTTYRKIAQYVTGKRDYEHIIGDIVKLAQHYNAKYIIPEQNSMRMQISFLAKAIKAAMGDDAPRISPFNMDNKRKDDLVKLMQQGMNEGLRLLDEPIARHQMRIFQARQTPTGLWTYGHPDNEHDDIVIADMLCHLATYQLRDHIN